MPVRRSAPNTRAAEWGRLATPGSLRFIRTSRSRPARAGWSLLAIAEIAASLRSLRNQGRRPTDDWLEHSELGYNYRISEMNCALGLAQLRRIDSILERRREVAEEYDSRLRGCPDLVLPLLTVPERVVSWFVYVVRLEREVQCRRSGCRPEYFDRARHWVWALFCADPSTGCISIAAYRRRCGFR